MNKRAPIPKLFPATATTVVVIIVLLPFVVIAISQAFDYLSRRM
jgi:hypothetical protein